MSSRTETTTVTKEYDDEGRLVKETTATHVQTTDDKPSPYTYPYIISPVGGGTITTSPATRPWAY